MTVKTLIFQAGKTRYFKHLSDTDYRYIYQESYIISFGQNRYGIMEKLWGDKSTIHLFYILEKKTTINTKERDI